MSKSLHISPLQRLIRLMGLSGFGDAGMQRRVLHVQSISCWAPSCIGPYSQAVASAGLVFFAGQIGLHPPTMQLLPGLHQQVQQCFDSCKVPPPEFSLPLRLISSPGILREFAQCK